MYARLVRLVMLVLLLVATPAVAQYTVQPGDTGWALAGKYYEDPATWWKIVEENPFLQEPGRVFERFSATTGEREIILLLKPGEVLMGLERLNVVAPVAVSLRDLKLEQDAPVVNTVVVTKTPTWLWWLLGLLLLVLIAAFRRYYIAQQHVALLARECEAREQNEDEERERILSEDPITSGTPYVPGGIAPTETVRLSNFFDQQAASRYAERTGVAPDAVHATRFGPIEEGTILGEGMVGYLGGEVRPRRIETPIRAYQARYRFPDGTEEVLQCLMGCMNPVAYGGEVYRGFTFVPGRVVVPEVPVTTAEPVATPAPVAEVVRPTQSTTTPASTVAETARTFVSFVPAGPNGPNMLRWHGLNVHAFDVEPDGTYVLRFTK